mmetsp:Transcript_4528/g.12739  ORF Transcript_4528/g.12739 Transcript_4528/m.12739 type:complete len:83 (-) Transcript_4528:65-313(-)
MDADEFQRILLRSHPASTFARTHATLFQIYMRGSQCWDTDVWCTSLSDLQKIAHLSMTHKVLPKLPLLDCTSDPSPTVSRTS